ncbi:tagatose kinase [Pseudoprimorskyibacter insulae]|uniref:2-dehydro-3-deoxygluconokinase n=1 Tax=Pseudoprimorskyibacter insulae TaxID=1695997 RepID=A0A2R8AX70_9RHOB|nr:sugar kinase [Pseudoprimorskyibacter insulae]SPF80651.1 2-dehydro-3-deoxygluconokinase [Pseudoprimorskyibacter insulae]
MISPDTLGPTICIGEILAEIVATTTGHGFAESQPLIGPFPSGAPAIFIDQCGRIGGKAAMIGAVGDDDFGRMNRARLERDGVDVSGIAVDDTLPTGSAFVRYRPDGDRDFVFNMWTSAAGNLRWTDAVEAVVSGAGHLHVMGTLLVRPGIWDMTDRAAQIIKARGGSISLDPNLRKELKDDGETAARLAQILEMTDVLLPSGDELQLAAGRSDRQAAIDALFARGITEIALKDGTRGATVFTPGAAPVHADAFAVTEVDPTGAGDCFGGAYIAARRLGEQIATALDLACAAGARNVTVRGPMEGAGTRQELEDFMKANRRITHGITA